MSNEDAARQLAPRPNLIFLPRAAALRLDSLLGQRHATIIPIGRDGPFRQGASLLNRPTGDQLVQALKTMGLSEQRALQIGRNCGHSATVLARLIPSGSPGALVGRHKKAQHPSAPLRAGVQRRDKQRKKDPFRSAEGLRVGRRAERNKETAYHALMDLQFTAVFRRVPEGYIAFVEELPGANTQGATLEEARANLQEAVSLVVEANRPR